MKAEITYQPESGRFEEFHFENSTVWNSQIFSWVKFEDLEYQDWYGSFRGQSLGHLAISEESGHVMIPTRDGTYLVNINNRQPIKFYGTEYLIRSVIALPNQGTFVLASCGELFRTNQEYELVDIPCQRRMDSIKLNSVSGNIIQFEFEDLGLWSRKMGTLNTETWEVE